MIKISLIHIENLNSDVACKLVLEDVDDLAEEEVVYDLKRRKKLMKKNNDVNDSIAEKIIRRIHAELEVEIEYGAKLNLRLKLSNLRKLS